MFQIKLDWEERDALRSANEKKEFWRDIRTKRGVHSLCLLGLLKQTRTTRTRAFYTITEAGREVAKQLPTLDEEWANISVDVFSPDHLSNRLYNAAVDPKVVASIEFQRKKVQFPAREDY